MALYRSYILLAVSTQHQMVTNINTRFILHLYQVTKEVSNEAATPLAFIDKYDHISRMIYDRSADFDDTFACHDKDLRLVEDHESDISHRLDAVSKDSVCRFSETSTANDRRLPLHFNRSCSCRGSYRGNHRYTLSLIPETSSVRRPWMSPHAARSHPSLPLSSTTPSTLSYQQPNRVAQRVAHLVVLWMFACLSRS